MFLIFKAVVCLRLSRSIFLSLESFLFLGIRHDSKVNTVVMYYNKFIRYTIAKESNFLGNCVTLIHRRLMVWWFELRPKNIFATSKDTKKIAHFISGQKMTQTWSSYYSHEGSAQVPDKHSINQRSQKSGVVFKIPTNDIRFNQYAMLHPHYKFSNKPYKTRFQ